MNFKAHLSKEIPFEDLMDGLNPFDLMTEVKVLEPIKAKNLTAEVKEPLEVRNNNNITLFQIAPSPINLENLKEELKGYSVSESKFLLNGFENGFSLMYDGPHEPSDSKNLKSALCHSSVVQEKIDKEVKLGRVDGPFKGRPLPSLRVSPIGLVPKKSDQKDFRLIHHLSYPKGQSLNDYIDPAKCSVQYTSFDTAVHMVQDLGPKCELFKMDIKSAFRLLPVHPADFDQLGFTFDDLYYFDKCLPFGCSISCNLFNRFADFLAFVVKRKAQNNNLMHYLDDFLGGGKQNSGKCKELMTFFSQTMQQLGVPIADEKTEGPATVLTFLGLDLDTEEMVVRLPTRKVQEILICLNALLHKNIQKSRSHIKKSLKK